MKTRLSLLEEEYDGYKIIQFEIRKQESIRQNIKDLCFQILKQSIQDTCSGKVLKGHPTPSVSSIKLLLIKLPNFNGKQEKLLFFYEIFICAVHSEKKHVRNIEISPPKTLP